MTQQYQRVEGIFSGIGELKGRRGWVVGSTTIDDIDECIGTAIVIVRVVVNLIVAMIVVGWRKGRCHVRPTAAVAAFLGFSPSHRLGKVDGRFLFRRAREFSVERDGRHGVDGHGCR